MIVTWITRPSFNATESDSTTAPTPPSWVQWDVTSDVQDYLDGTKTNYGWQVMDAIGGVDNSLLRFWSRDYLDGGYHPQLELSFNVIYVDESATGSGDGSSWTNAYTTLQGALYRPPAAGDHIWVAQGTYKPDQGGGQSAGNRSTTFALIDGVAICGGFPTGGGDWQERDPQGYPTILSGDISTVSDNSDNCYHVVTAGSGISSSTVLDGFTITAGDANDTFPDNYGAGMYNEGDPIIANCTFVDNWAEGDGGGLYNTYCAPALINCTFYRNGAGDEGGGVRSGYCDNMTLVNCVFLENEAGDDGGAVGHYNCSATFTNCIFRGNYTSGGSYSDGGAISNNEGSSPTLINCLFSGNHATYRGGGIYNTGEEYASAPVLINCSLSGNHANSLGGGMYTDNETDNDTAEVVNCIFWGNTHGDVSDHTAQIAGPDSPTVTYSCIGDADWNNYHPGDV